LSDSDKAGTQPAPEMTAMEARAEAQRLVFSPFMFQALRVLVTSGVLGCIKEAGGEGIVLETLKKQCPDLSTYAIRLLLDAGVVCKVLSYTEGRFVCTKVGWFLLRDDLTRVNMSFTHSVCYKGLYHLEESLRTGKPAGLRELGDWETVYEGLPELPEEARRDWFAFDHHYSDHAFEKALTIVFEDAPTRMLDIGGNTGRFALACTAFNPDVRLTLCDLPGQLRQAMANVEKAGAGDRVSGHAVNLLDAEATLPGGHDAAWMSQFLCCFSETEIVHILERVREAVRPDGRVFILETFWDRQAHAAGAFSLIATSLYFTAIANGNSRMYRYRDMKACIEAAGLEIVDVEDNIGLGHTLLGCRPSRGLHR
jgi:ubiquinone/menaquinone biosynthesis C-methylase UbiE